MPTIIVEPAMLLREGIRRILTEVSFQVVWCDATPPLGQIQSLSTKVSPLFIIGSDISEAIIQLQQLKQLYPTARAVLLLDRLTQYELATAIRHGADTIVFKSTSCEALISTLKLVLEGASIFPTELLNVFIAERGLQAITNVARAGKSLLPDNKDAGALKAFGFSPRERSVLKCILDGMANKEIARELSISEATTKAHVKAILRKAQVRNRTQVAMWAYKLGFGTVGRAAFAGLQEGTMASYGN